MAIDPNPASEHDVDVLVIGGGPAGSTIATLLADKGHRVAVLEKDHHPRFHIGESLLPANLPLLERLGVAEEVRAIGMQKWGAEFVAPWLGRSQTFEFKDSWDPSPPFAYQVKRADFDEILIRRAARAGARVVEGCRVREVTFGTGERPVLVTAVDDADESSAWRARFLVDASGRDTFLATRLDAKKRNRKHNSAAMYGHFRGVALRAEKHAGDISIYWFDHGWFWVIPLADGTTSIGAVVWPAYMKARDVPVSEYLLATIALCEPLAERLKDATLVTAAEATGNYSYTSSHSHGPHYILIGDAYAFVDPVFSSGVWLAMNSAVEGAAVVEACLDDRAHARAVRRRFDRTMRRGPRVFSWFIYRITNPTMRELFMNPRNDLRMKNAILSVLAGDIFGKTPIWGSLRAFKAVYYFVSIFNLRRTALAYRKHAADIKPVLPGG
jgi:flavin-dependent dehydrogenase